MSSAEVREILSEVLVDGPPHEGTGRGRRLRRLRRDLWVRRFMLLARLNRSWLRAKHRWLGLHTFGEVGAWDFDRGYLQYRGWRCLVCDEASDF